MRLYYEIALRAFRLALTYRAAYLAGALTNAFFGVVRSYIYIALYGAGGSVAGFTLRDAIEYTWITQVLFGVAVISLEIDGTIRTGDVVTDLFRPWSFYGYWLSRFLGERACNLLLRGLLTYAIGALLFAVPLPAGGTALAFVATIGLSLLVSFTISFIVNLTAFWLLDNAGVITLANALMVFFSGLIVPPSFMPPPLAALARALPFQALGDLPARVFLGQVTGAALGQALLVQALWLAALTAAGALLVRRALRKVVIQGG